MSRIKNFLEFRLKKDATFQKANHRRFERVGVFQDRRAFRLGMKRRMRLTIVRLEKTSELRYSNLLGRG